MDSRLQELIDHHEIRKTLIEYCHGCDRCDAPRMASVYAEDSWDDHGGVKGPGSEFARSMTANIVARYDCMYHLLGQSLIVVEGDEAGAETYFLAIARTRGDDDSIVCNEIGGRFVDRMVRNGSGWKIKHSIVMGETGTASRRSIASSHRRRCSPLAGNRAKIPSTPRWGGRMARVGRKPFVALRRTSPRHAGPRGNDSSRVWAAQWFSVSRMMLSALGSPVRSP